MERLMLEGGAPGTRSTRQFMAANPGAYGSALLAGFSAGAAGPRPTIGSGRRRSPWPPRTTSPPSQRLPSLAGQVSVSESQLRVRVDAPAYRVIRRVGDETDVAVTVQAVTTLDGVESRTALLTAGARHGKRPPRQTPNGATLTCRTLTSNTGSACIYRRPGQASGLEPP